jgi:hypothetical protein
MCNKSETISKIAMALVSFSGEVRSIEKDGTNPHFKSAYTTLDHMIDETKPLLHKHGLTIMQFPGGDGEKVTVRTMILHNSGEWIESEALTLKASKLDPQGAGSAITYARRYSYAAALSLSLGDDDDGNSSSQAPTKPVQASQNNSQTNTPTSTQTAPESTTETHWDNHGGSYKVHVSPALISAAQIKYAHTLKSKKKISEDDFSRMVSEHGNDSLSSFTMTQAKIFINFLTAIADPA